MCLYVDILFINVFASSFCLFFFSHSRSSARFSDKFLEMKTFVIPSDSEISFGLETSAKRN